MGTERSSGVREGGRGISQKGRSACRFPMTTEITELRSIRSTNDYKAAGNTKSLLGNNRDPILQGGLCQLRVDFFDRRDEIRSDIFAIEKGPRGQWENKKETALSG